MMSDGEQMSPKDLDNITLENFDEVWPLPSVEECEANSRILTQTPYGLQDGNGVDVTLIYSALRKTPLERLREGDFARRSVEYIHAHANRIDGPSGSRSRTVQTP
jgi:hypothetical protein